MVASVLFLVRGFPPPPQGKNANLNADIFTAISVTQLRSFNIKGGQNIILRLKGLFW